jgi:hypothetical protein
MTPGRRLASDAKIAQGMGKNGELTEAMKAMKNIVDDTSWFRGTPYYWAEASLPLAYAVACVEVVSKSSESELHSVRARMDITQAKTVPEMQVSLLE